MKNLIIVLFINILFTSGITISNVTDKPYIEDVAHIILNKLDIDNVTIDIIDVDNLDHVMKGTDLNAMTKSHDNDEFTIYIKLDNLNKKEIITILAHEFIHIKQFHTKRLIELNNREFEYEGKHINVEKDDYRIFPWEHEAFSKQKELSKYVINNL